MWKFCRKKHSFGRIAWNYTETVLFRKIFTPGDQVKLWYFRQCHTHSHKYLITICEMCRFSSQNYFFIISWQFWVFHLLVVWIFFRSRMESNIEWCIYLFKVIRGYAHMKSTLGESCWGVRQKWDVMRRKEGGVRGSECSGRPIFMYFLH